MNNVQKDLKNTYWKLAVVHEQVKRERNNIAPMCYEP